MNEPQVSIIIAVSRPSDYLLECIRACRKLEYPKFEIIVLPDDSYTIEGAKVIPTGKARPSQKRNLGAKHAKGEILAFLDDDAYPVKSWLMEAVKFFSDPKVAAVGGPAVTPSSDSILQKASGLVYSSPLGGGTYTYRYRPGKARKVDDFPTCNLLVRRKTFNEVNGFNTNYWPGEDTKFCLDLISKGYSIIYSPKVLAYHHRRPLFRRHLRQVWNYSIHRGFFAKRFPQTSARLSYLPPTLLLLTILLFLSSYFLFPQYTFFLSVPLLLYLSLTLLFSILSSSDLRVILLVFFGILSTHAVYGIGFPVGLLKRRMDQ